MKMMQDVLICKIKATLQKIFINHYCNHSIVSLHYDAVYLSGFYEAILLIGKILKDFPFLIAPLMMETLNS